MYTDFFSSYRVLHIDSLPLGLFISVGKREERRLKH